MRPAVTLLVLGALLSVVGCKESTSGGLGAALPASEQSKFRQSEDTFSLNTPMMSTKLAQGETKALAIGITRGKNIDQDVTLMFHDLPKGVTVDPTGPVIRRGDVDAKITLKAASDASLGDFTIKVMGHPAQGPDATADLTITVAQI